MKRLMHVTLVLVLAVALLGCEPSSSTSSPTSNAESAVPETSASAEPSAALDPCLIPVAKPVIYLYPKHTERVSVAITVDGLITHTEPLLGRDGQWLVSAEPSGRLTDPETGLMYPYLFWEADAACDIDMSTGFVVTGPETRRFLEQKLAFLGLTASESADFTAYWVPLMEPNAYNVVHFEGPAYERAVRLEVQPEPDRVIRVFMAFEPADRPIGIAPQVLHRPEPRGDFTVVEWGGAQLPRR